ncbi:MAG TPA: hypothetical protein VMF91_02785 [Bryobacteraceae bacterium]|nr:hypothetical protein [Bryobacteraceae bacterium]
MARSDDIKILAKRDNQRTPIERKQVERGLRRGVVLDLVLFAPASVCLLYLAFSPVVEARFPVPWRATAFALLGVISYGFPFATVRRFVTRLTLGIIQKFALVMHDEARAEYLGDKD